MVLFQRNQYFPRIQRGYNIFQGYPTNLFPGGGGGGGGVQMLISIETHMTCNFLGGEGGSGPLFPPLDSRMNSTEDNYICRLAMNIADSIEGAQWFSGRVLDSRPKDHTGVTALWSLSKTHIS